MKKNLTVKFDCALCKRTLRFSPILLKCWNGFYLDIESLHYVRRYLFDMRHIDVILFSSWKINLRANQFLQRFFPILLLPSFYKYLIIIKQPPYFIVFLLKIRQYFFMINHRASCVWPNCALSNVLYVFSLFFWAFIFYFHYSNVSITMATRVHTASFWNIIFSWLPMMIWQKN